MDIKPHEEYRTDAGEDVTIVPTEEYRILKAFEQGCQDAAERNIPPCQHPEDKLESIEALDDMTVCNRCGALLISNGPGVWVRANVYDLEARIYRYFAQSLSDMDDALSFLTSRAVGDMLRWRDSVERGNPIINRLYKEG